MADDTTTKYDPGYRAGQLILAGTLLYTVPKIYRDIPSGIFTKAGRVSTQAQDYADIVFSSKTTPSKAAFTGYEGLLDKFFSGYETPQGKIPLPESIQKLTLRSMELKFGKQFIAPFSLGQEAFGKYIKDVPEYAQYMEKQLSYFDPQSVLARRGYSRSQARGVVGQYMEGGGLTDLQKYLYPTAKLEPGTFGVGSATLHELPDLVKRDAVYNQLIKEFRGSTNPEMRKSISSLATNLSTLRGNLGGGKAYLRVYNTGRESEAIGVVFEYMGSHKGDMSRSAAAQVEIPVVRNGSIMYGENLALGSPRRLIPTEWMSEMKKTGKVSQSLAEASMKYENVLSSLLAYKTSGFRGRRISEVSELFGSTSSRVREALTTSLKEYNPVNVPPTKLHLLRKMRDAQLLVADPRTLQAVKSSDYLETMMSAAKIYEKEMGYSFLGEGAISPAGMKKSVIYGSEIFDILEYNPLGMTSYAREEQGIRPFSMWRDIFSPESGLPAEFPAVSSSMAEYMSKSGDVPRTLERGVSGSEFALRFGFTSRYGKDYKYASLSPGPEEVVTSSSFMKTPWAGYESRELMLMGEEELGGPVFKAIKEFDVKYQSQLGDVGSLSKALSENRLEDYIRQINYSKNTSVIKQNIVGSLRQAITIPKGEYLGIDVKGGGDLFKAGRSLSEGAADVSYLMEYRPGAESTAHVTVANVYEASKGGWKTFYHGKATKTASIQNLSELASRVMYGSALEQRFTSPTKQVLKAWESFAGKGTAFTMEEVTRQFSGLLPKGIRSDPERAAVRLGEHLSVRKAGLVQALGAGKITGERATVLQHLMLSTKQMQDIYKEAKNVSFVSGEPYSKILGKQSTFFGESLLYETAERYKAGHPAAEQIKLALEGAGYNVGDVSRVAREAGAAVEMPLTPAEIATGVKAGKMNAPIIGIYRAARAAELISPMQAELLESSMMGDMPALQKTVMKYRETGDIYRYSKTGQFADELFTALKSSRLDKTAMNAETNLILSNIRQSLNKDLSEELGSMPLLKAMSPGGTPASRGAGNLATLSTRAMGKMLGAGWEDVARDLATRQSSQGRSFMALAEVGGSLTGQMKARGVKVDIHDPRLTDRLLSGITSADPRTRKESLAAIGVGQGENIIFGFDKTPVSIRQKGDLAGRTIREVVLPTELSNLIGTTTVGSEFEHISRPLERSVMNLVHAVRSPGAYGAEEATLNLYANISENLREANKRMMGGRVAGSFYGQAKSGRFVLEDLYRMYQTGEIKPAGWFQKQIMEVGAAQGVGYEQAMEEAFRGVGVKGEVFERLAREAGYSGAELQQARRSGLYGLVTREPITQQQRISPTRIFDIEPLLKAFGQKGNISQFSNDMIATMEFQRMSMKADYDADMLSVFVSSKGKGERSAQDLVRGVRMGEEALGIQDFAALEKELEGISGAKSYQTMISRIDKTLDPQLEKILGMDIPTKEKEMLISGFEHHRGMAHTLAYAPILKAEDASILSEQILRGTTGHIERQQALRISGLLEKEMIGRFSQIMTKADLAAQTSGVSEMSIFNQLRNLLEEKPIQAKHVGDPMQQWKSTLQVLDLMEQPIGTVETAKRRASQLKDLIFSQQGIFGVEAEQVGDLAEETERMMIAMQQFETKPEARLWAAQTGGGRTISPRALLSASPETLTQYAMEKMQGLEPSLGSRSGTRLRQSSRYIGEAWSEIATGIGKNKRALMYGLGTAAAVGLVFGKPGRISGNETEMESAKDFHGSPSTPDIYYNQTARLEDGLDASSKVRMKSTGEVDPGIIAHMVGKVTNATPLASIVDHRSQLHADYILDRFEGV